MTLLSCRGVSVSYGTNLALDTVDLDAYRGEVLALIGPNGAGKSTLLDAIAGGVRATGTIVVDGVAVDGLGAAARATSGIGRVFQTPRLAGPTAVDDVVLAAPATRSLVAGAFRMPRAADRRTACDLLARVELDESLWQVSVDQLGLPDRRRVELARALAGDPCLLLLDEPASGLPDHERSRLLELIVDLATDRGVVLVEHDMALVAGAAHHVVALDRGRIIAEGSYADVAADRSVRESYLGADHAIERRPVVESSADPVLQIAGLHASHGSIEVLHGVDIDVRAGEIVAVLGPNGAGKSTLARSVAGMHANLTGVISMHGCPLPSGDPGARRGASLASVSDARDLVPSLTVDRYLRLLLGPDEIARTVERFPRLGELVDRRCGALSGGEAQLVALARALGSDPAALVIDELSQGLAPVALDALLPAVRGAADGGCAVVLVEQFAHAASRIADRVILLDQGSVRYDGPVDDAPLDEGYLRPGDVEPPPPTSVLSDVTVGLLPRQRRALRQLAEATGQPAGQALRDALEAYLGGS